MVRRVSATAFQGKPGANVRQMAGRPGEAWGGESGTNRLVVIQTILA